MLDKRCAQAIVANKNMAVPWFILASYAYYKEDDTILTDAAFDFLCKFLAHYWPEIVHRHKHLLHPGDFMTGSGFAIGYPSITEGALKSLRNE